MRRRTDKTKALRLHFWKNTLFIMRRMGLCEYEFANLCNYSENSFHAARSKGCLSLDMAIIICEQLAEPLDDMFYTDYESAYKAEGSGVE
jgi:hypothetical protein